MSFASDSGYTPSTIQTMMLSVMTNVNTQFGTSYTEETFIGSNFYKYFYALIQELQKNEIKTAEIFTKLTDYLSLTNERISRPVVTNPGLIDKFASIGYIASVKKPIDSDAGKLFVCVDVDDTAIGYAAKKLIINTVIKDSSVAGVVTQGDQVNTIVLSNGQSFDFKFKLPTRINVKLRLTVTLSANNQVVIGSPDDMKVRLMANIAALYRLGRNFEPQRYFTPIDAPWSQAILLEYSIDNGATWSSTVYQSAYDTLFVVKLENIVYLEN